MKRLIAVLTAVMMALACLPAMAEEPAAAADVPASATTVNVKLSADKEELKNLVAMTPAQQNLAAVEPVLDLLNALEIRAVAAGDGLQIDLGLNGTTALTLAGEADEKGLVIGSSLIPNHLMSISAEQLQTILQQFVPAAVPVKDSVDMAAAGESLGKYFSEFIIAFSKAVTAGETETGSWEFDGVSFDTKTPQDIDEAALTEAAKKLVRDLLTDETIKGALAAAPNFDADRILKDVDETLSEGRIPEVKADVYGSSGESAAASCLVLEATYKEQEKPAYTVTVLNRATGEVRATMHIAQSDADIVVTVGPTGMLAELLQGEAYIGLRLSVDEAGISLDVLSAPEKAALTLTVTVSREGERTLSLDPEGKTILVMEDLQNGNAEAAQSLLQELQVNAMSLLQQPEIAGLITSLMKLQQPPVKDNPQAEADPTAWKKLGDVMALDVSDMASTGGGGSFDMVFKYGGRYWWVKADVPQEAMDQYFGIDYSAEDRKALEIAAIGDCEITGVTDLSTLAIPQDELDQWIGKTYQDMLDAGWEQNGYDIEPGGLLVHMVNGQFQYNVSFGDTVKMPETWTAEIDLSGGIVAGVTFAGPSFNFAAD